MMLFLRRKVKLKKNLTMGFSIEHMETSFKIPIQRGQRIRRREKAFSNIMQKQFFSVWAVLLLLFNEQNMLNKQRQGSEKKESQGKYCGMVYSILYHKYSEQPRLNYECQKFHQYVSNNDGGDGRTGLQLQCLEFLSLFNDKELLTTYHTLKDIFSSISSTILKRTALNHSSPIIFHEPYIHKALIKYNHLVAKTKISSSPPHQILLNSQTSQIQKSRDFSEEPVYPLNFPPGSTPLSSKQNQQLEESSLTVLERINRELSVMLRKLNESQLEVNLTAYLTQINQIKSPIRVSPSHNESEKSQGQIKGKISFPVTTQKIESSTLHWQQAEEETENYGLYKMKKKKKIHEQKEKASIFSQTETIRKKVKQKESISRQSPHTPQPEYVHHCLSINEFRIDSHRNFSLGNKKVLGKKFGSMEKLLKKQPKRPILTNQNKKKPKSKSKSKERKGAKDHKIKETQEKHRKWKKTKIKK